MDNESKRPADRSESEDTARQVDASDEHTSPFAYELDDEYDEREIEGVIVGGGSLPGSDPYIMRYNGIETLAHIQLNGSVYIPTGCSIPIAALIELLRRAGALPGQEAAADPNVSKHAKECAFEYEEELEKQVALFTRGEIALRQVCTTLYTLGTTHGLAAVDVCFEAAKREPQETEHEQ